MFLAWYRKSQEFHNTGILNNGTDGNTVNATNHTNWESSNSLGLVDYPDEITSGELPWNEQILAFIEMRFKGFTSIAIPAFAVSYIFFFGIGGFLHVSNFDQIDVFKCICKL